MAALVVSLGVGGSAEVGIPEVSALVVGGVVGWRARSLPSVLVAGMVTLWVLRALI
jgi:branched-subunit amino acid transport protein